MGFSSRHISIKGHFTVLCFTPPFLGDKPKSAFRSLHHIRMYASVALHLRLFTNKLHDDRLSNSKCLQTKRANWNLFVTWVALRGHWGSTRSGRGKKNNQSWSRILSQEIRLFVPQSLTPLIFHHEEEDGEENCFCCPAPLHTDCFGRENWFENCFVYRRRKTRIL